MTLELTNRQAYYLWCILQHVGGDPKGPRGDMDDVFHNLCRHKGEFEDVIDQGEIEISGGIEIDKS